MFNSAEQIHDLLSNQCSEGTPNIFQKSFIALLTEANDDLIDFVKKKNYIEFSAYHPNHIRKTRHMLSFRYVFIFFLLLRFFLQIKYS